jgi:hypothetical protein
LTFLIDRAAAGRFIPPQSRIDHRSRAAHTRAYANSLRGAVLSAGSAFHAGVTVFDPDPSIILAQDSMRADHQAHAATDAFFLV